jgi:hypothetical protein
VFGELPKLFDRDFAIGFFLPLIVFVPCLYAVASGFPTPTVLLLLDNFNTLMGQKTPWEATLAIVFVWLGGILLLVLNGPIIRFKEGYGRWNPLKMLRWIEVGRFRRLQRAIDALEAERDALRELRLDLDERSVELAKRLFLERAERFPNAEYLVLPTAFGNVIRAWEMYPQVMYGIDAISGWDRLIFLVPEKERPLISQDKAFLDFWLNIWFLSLVALGEYCALAVVTRQRGSMWAFLSIPMAIIASNRARQAAKSWGMGVKAAFDVFLPELREKLGIASDLSRDDERKQWAQMSRAMVHRNPEALPSRISKPVEKSAKIKE